MYSKIYIYYILYFKSVYILKVYKIIQSCIPNTHLYIVYSVPVHLRLRVYLMNC